MCMLPLEQGCSGVRKRQKALENEGRNGKSTWVPFQRQGPSLGPIAMPLSSVHGE
jgi:hypothetical protein